MEMIKRKQAMFLKSSELSTKPFTLPRMTTAQYEKVLRLAREKNINLHECPTCRNSRIEVAPGVWIWENSTYKLNGEGHPCNCEEQDLLRRHYLLANIPKDYWTLEVDDYWGDQEALVKMVAYLDKWGDYQWLGFGLEFYSPSQGTGKTMLATILAKRLIRKQESVYFIGFREATRLYDLPVEQREEKINHLRATPILVLDDVGDSISEAQGAYFAVELEDLIRARTSGNAVTIMTTNLTPEELAEKYQRSFSLLQAKQDRVFVSGIDSRQNGAKRMVDFELIANGEVRPIR
jgi:DNA replication protein DnaC